MSADGYLTGELVPAGTTLRGEGTLAQRTVPAHERVAARWLLAQTSPNTVEAYRRDLRQFFDWCAEFGFDPLMLGRTESDGYRRWLDDRLKHATRARKLSVVSSFYRFGMQNFPELVPSNPMDAVKRPKVSQRSKTAGLTMDQARRLFEVAAEAGTWEHAMVRVLLHTGMRVSELVNARTWDIRRDPDGWTIEITRKGDLAARIALVDEAYAAVQAHVGRRTGPILLGRNGGQVSRQEIARQLGYLARRAGDDLPEITPHCLRHTAATLAIRAGVRIEKVQEMLGHALLTTTMRYYHAATEVRDSAAHGLAAAYRGDS